MSLPIMQFRMRNMQNQGQNCIPKWPNLTECFPNFVLIIQFLLRFGTLPEAPGGKSPTLLFQIQSRNPIPEPNVAPVVAPVVTPVPKASIPFPSRRNDERRKEKANDQIEKFYEIFRDLSFEISFTDCRDAHA
ncbi:hypothetical protein Tco_0013027 [Tanacetum coccineum]